MERIGIRELRQHAGKWVAKAKAGTPIEITDRGRPVARLTPISPADLGREALIADGLLVPALQPRRVLEIDDLVDSPPLSGILDQMRSDR